MRTPHQYQGQGRRRRKRARFSQASTRRPIVLYDQHGREWTAQVGLKSGMPTGSIVPSFRAPWYPDQQYLRVNPDNTSELFIDYRAMLLRRRARMSEYHRGAIDWARDHSVAEPTKLGEYSDQIRRGYGAPPKPLQPIVAAMQGNRYILGLTNKVDPRLERYVVKPRDEEFTAEFDFRDLDDEAASPDGTESRAPAPKRERPALNLSTEDDIKEFDGIGPAAAAAEGDGGDLDIERFLEDIDEEVKEEELEETFDPKATGGTRVPPKKVARAEGQASRQGDPPRPRPKRGTKLSEAKKRQIGDRPTLADGAKPVVSD